MTNVNGLNLLNTISADFLKNVAGNKKHESDKIELFNVAGNNISVTDGDGETFNLSMASVAKELKMTQDAIKTELEKTKAPDGLAGANAATAATGSGSASQLKAELDKLEQEKSDNKEMMVEIEEKITLLEEEVRLSLKNATAEMETEEEKHKAVVEAKINEQVDQYKRDKQGGKDVTPETLSKNVTDAITKAGAPKFAAALSEIMSADTDIRLMDSMLGVLNEHISIEKDLDSQINVKSQAYESAKAAEEEAARARAAERPDGCEPQGFQIKEGENTVQYDFFVDRDGDGDLSDAQELLGAKEGAKGKTDKEIQEKGWSEMTQLDLDGNGEVTFDEMTDEKATSKSGGEIMVMKSVYDASGNKIGQEAVSLEEAFGKDSQYGGALSINTKQESGLSSQNAPMNFNDAGYSNKLLGNFGVTLGAGEEAKNVTGYQTLDDIDFLNDNFKFSKGVDGKTGGAKENNGIATDDEAFYNKYMEEVMPELKEALKTTKTNLGLSEDLLKLIDEVSGDSAANLVTEFTKELEEKEKAQKAKRDEETAQTDEAGEEEIDTRKETQQIAA